MTHSLHELLFSLTATVALDYASPSPKLRVTIGDPNGGGELLTLGDHHNRNSTLALPLTPSTPSPPPPSPPSFNSSYSSPSSSSSSSASSSSSSSSFPPPNSPDWLAESAHSGSRQCSFPSRQSEEQPAGTEDGALQGQLEEVAAGYTFFCSGRSRAKRQDAGVTFAIRNDIVGRLPCLPQGINDRLMSLRFPHWGGEIPILVNIFAPPISSPDETRNKFYAELHALLASEPTTW
ncbi:hypothetical protein SprV_1002846500 [Sparganum proliferum]